MNEPAIAVFYWLAISFTALYALVLFAFLLQEEEWSLLLAATEGRKRKQRRKPACFNSARARNRQ